MAELISNLQNIGFYPHDSLGPLIAMHQRTEIIAVLTKRVMYEMFVFIPSRSFQCNAKKEINNS